MTTATRLPTAWGDLWDQDGLTYADRRTIQNETPINRRSIEAQYAPIDDAAIRAVRKLVNSDRTEGDHVEKVRRHDETAVEVVWYDDWASEDDEASTGPTKVSDLVLDRLEEDLQSFFGELWRVDRKPDARRRSGKNVQRALVHRVSHLDFRYEGEEKVVAAIMRDGTPEGCPDDAREWGDLDHWVRSPNEVDYESNLYVYETSTGTQHLVSPVTSYHGGFYYEYVTEGASTICGQPLDPQTLADADAFEHFPELAHDHYESETTKPSVYRPDVRADPEGVLGKSLCGSCWRSFADTNDDDELVPPSDIDWVNMRMWGSDQPVSGDDK